MSYSHGSASKHKYLESINFLPNYSHCQDPETPEGEQYWFVDQIIYHNNWWEVFS